jgi:prepilin-type N-terminal cleavage/methylation domain-containing protein
MLARRLPSCRGFTLIEILVVVVVIGILLAVLLPSIAAMREAGRSAVCLSNLRQCVMACRTYADDYRGRSPAIGQPYAALPNWALVVLAASGRDGESAADLYSRSSVLVCPTIDAFYPEDMTRTYAMNATGHAGLPSDPDNYDDANRPAFINLDRILEPTGVPLIFDSAVAPIAGDAPPPARTASVLDFRQPQHVAERLGLFHGARSQAANGGHSTFNIGFADSSARPDNNATNLWYGPLP